MVEHLIFLSVPGLRPQDIVDRKLTPNLHQMCRGGASCTLVPTFPCVTSPVQASMLTGLSPREHGVIANGFYYADRGEVKFWVGDHQVIEQPTFITRLVRQRPDLTSAAWCAQNIKGADATYIVTPAPIHGPDGTTKPWCYSKPEGLYEEMLGELDHFPLQHYWGPLANIRSTQWIVEGALWLAGKYAPNFQYVYVPHLDYAAQKFGPESPEAKKSLAELDGVIGDFVRRYNQLAAADRTAWVLAGEYALTPVDGAICPNRLLREAGFLKVREEDDGEYLDLAGSDAFAMVDHQIAHVYVEDDKADAVADLFRDVDGIADIAVGNERAAIGMDHQRSAPVLLISQPDQWFAYYWWLDDSAAPPFSRTVDIHAKPGYDPVELFVEMEARKIPLDVTLVKGSHGAPVTRSDQHTLLISTHPDLLEDLPNPVYDTDVFSVLCRAFGVEP